MLNFLGVVGLLACLTVTASAQSSSNDTIGLANGYTSFTTPNWKVKIVKDSQLLASLKPTGEDFDFSPFDYLQYRAADGNYHLGDINLRYRQGNSQAWMNASSASERQNVTAMDPKTLGANVLAASDMTPTLPNGLPFRVVRQWITSGDELGLTFTLTNTGNSLLEIGSVGFPIEFNSIFTNRNNINDVCSLTDPSINVDGGYLRVAPMSGNGSALAVTGLGSTPLEAWNFLYEDTSTVLQYWSQTFEGFYEWQPHTLAYAQQEWASVQPWNPPTSQKLSKGQNVTWGLQFNLASSITDIEQAVTDAGTPHVISIPGYIVPMDLTAQLIFTSDSPITSIATSPANAATFELIAGNNTYNMVPTGKQWGRVRVTVTYLNGKTHTISYYITKSAPQALADLGNFITTKQWFTNASDPFHRAPSPISYDNDAMAQVLQDERAWIPGLSDEAGAGSFVAAHMKQVARPNAAEVKKLDQFLMQVVHGVLQPSNTTDPYSVRRSIFYYQPDLLPNYRYSSEIDWTNWWSWDQADSYDTWRTYDYVWATSAWWSQYRVSRGYPSIKVSQPWSYYLNQAYQTAMRAVVQFPQNETYITGYVQVGLMGETVWGELLQDLYRENMTSMAQSFEAAMFERAQYWNGIPDPFGSEQAWDCTGQEGVYYWTKYFGFGATAMKTIDTIFGYMPAISHWGWNGNARRYWDFIYGGKLMRYERQIHHYGSGLNALPLMAYYRSTATTAPDTLALRTAYGGMNGPLSNINQNGGSHVAFHSWPDTLRWDGYSGDYGPNHLGLILGSGVYVHDDASLGGTVAFGANFEMSGSVMTLQPRDAVRQRIFIGPWGLMVELSAGAIESAVVDMGSSTLTLAVVDRVDAGSVRAAQAIVWVSDGVVTQGGAWSPFSVTSGGQGTSRGGTVIVLGDSATQIVISK